MEIDRVGKNTFQACKFSLLCNPYPYPSRGLFDISLSLSVLFTTADLFSQQLVVFSAAGSSKWHSNHAGVRNAATKQVMNKPLRYSSLCFSVITHSHGAQQRSAPSGPHFQRIDVLQTEALQDLIASFKCFSQDKSLLYSLLARSQKLKSCS